MEYNEDDYITSYYRKEQPTKPLGTVNGYNATGITVPADHPDYQRQYWEKVRKPLIVAERDRAKGLLTVEECWDIVSYARTVRHELEVALDANELLDWQGGYRVHNGIRWVHILWDEETGEWAARFNGQLHSDTDPFGDYL